MPKINGQYILLSGDLLKLKLLNLQATLHVCIKNPVVNGYLKFTVDQRCDRKKWVKPTKLAYKYVYFMSDCLLKAYSN